MASAAALAACGTIDHGERGAGPTGGEATRTSEPPPPPLARSAWGVEDPAIVRLAGAVVDQAPADEADVNLACFVQGPAAREEGAWLPGDYPDVAASFVAGWRAR
ncbi:MAG: hypothetical protein U1F43_29790 [Myxococcota bacterium]